MPGLEHVLTNPFLAATKISASRAMALGDFTDNALKGDGNPPEIAALYNAYHPVREAYRTLWIEGSSSRGERKGKTLEQKILLRELSQRIKDWGLQIEMVHRRDTPEYLSFLPQGRTPFRQGSYEARAGAVRQLVLELQKEPVFSGLQAEVQAFSDELGAAIGQAIGAESKKIMRRNELEKGRIALSNALYAVLGGLIHLYPDRPQMVASYFDVATMHRRRHRVKNEE